MHFQNNTFSFTYLTIRLVSPLNNPQNNEMKFCENMKLTCRKLSEFIGDYTLNTFSTHITNIIVNDGKKNIILRLKKKSF